MERECLKKYDNILIITKKLISYMKIMLVIFICIRYIFIF